MSSEKPTTPTQSLTFWAATIAIGCTLSLGCAWEVHLHIHDQTELPEFLVFVISALIFIGGSALCFCLGFSILKHLENLRIGNQSHHLIPLAIGALFAWARPNPEEEVLRSEAIHMLHLGMEIYILIYFLCYLALSHKLRVPLLWIHKIAPVLSALTIAWLFTTGPK